MRKIQRKSAHWQKYKKFYKKRKRKSILKSRFFWLALLFLIVISGLIYFFIFSQVFQIEKIDVFGCQKVKREDILGIVEEQINKKIVFFQTKSIFLPILGKTAEIILENFPQIENVELRRNLPDGLAVEIKERGPRVVFTQGEDYFFIDSSGVVFEKIGREVAESFLKIKSSPSPSSLRELGLGEKIIDDDLLEQIFRIESEFKNNLKIELEEMVILEDRLTVKTIEGWEVYFAPEEELNWQLTELKVVLEKEIPSEKREDLEYIDLRFSRVYYKYR